MDAQNSENSNRPEQVQTEVEVSVDTHPTSPETIKMLRILNGKKNEMLPALDADWAKEAREAVVDAWKSGDHDLAKSLALAFRVRSQENIMTLGVEQQMLGDLALNFSIAMMWMSAGRLDMALEDLLDVYDQASNMGVLDSDDMIEQEDGYFS